MDGMTALDWEGFLGPVLNLQTAEIVTSLLTALALGFVVSIVYRFSVPGRVLSPALQSSLILLAMVAAMVMMVIGNNLARAFSLVGALAIIRFRTRLRSPWDITFIFLSLAAGIGCGVFAYRVAVLGTILTGLAVLALQVIPLGGGRSDRIRHLRCDVASFEGIDGRMEGIFDRFLKRKWLMESRSLRFGESLSFRYRIELRKVEDVAPLMRELGAVEGVERVVLDLGEDGAPEE